MILAAILCGLLAAYYFGLRAGYLAAGIAAGLFLVAWLIPSSAMIAYGLVAAGVIGLCVFGPRLRKPGQGLEVPPWARKQALRAWKKWTRPS